jgi:hypothetical protein
LTVKYPELTPYQFASNMPIIAIDLDGEEAKIVTIYYSAQNGQEFYRTVQNDKSVINQTLNVTTTIHKYPVSTQNGTIYKQVGPDELTLNRPVNFQTGRIDLTNNNELAWGAKVSDRFRSKLKEIATNLDINPDYLMSAMAFESDETFSPSIKNRNSSATGLIQFMNSTASGLGTTTKELSKMTSEQQLDYVEKYFKGYKGKLKNIEDVYMVILYPVAVGKSDDYVVFKKDDKITGAAYSANAGLDANNDGIVTKQEATAPVKKKLEKGENKYKE